ncbi:TAXI family TRAP transporter solute-binding subunit [Microvirga rosea]|uniref:TAXI family TRAP transporter solute-binding subunit n=1 Tax=Microvirga rosea TaxID=2715425 RepID=UPI001D0BE222|nr:TAXI family TRAP transporter solute-binding subunit [Microvirga rosea]MCB8822471.1 TAXI family TRAP transporter solute-binding subunit [Microvirga rosea]
MPTSLTRRHLAKLGLGLGAAAALGRNALAQAPAFFRIGTGGTAGTYYPVGGLLANAISSPPQLILTAQASNGSVANINSIASGALESGFSQADVAYWAYTGTGLFEGKSKLEDLRLLANLYPESIHLVAAKAANIKSVADLKGKRVSLDEPGSGTLVDARIILNAWGIKEGDVKADFLKPNQAAEKMRDGGMDAFFFVGGYPTSAITELAATGGGIDIVPLAGPEADALMKQYNFFSTDEIPANTYKDVGAVKTLAVGAHWITSAKVPENVVYEVVKNLWSDKTRAALDAGHAKGKFIRKETALTGAGIPVHPGAAKFYKEAGLLKA